jgi:hypothetical protein
MYTCLLRVTQVLKYITCAPKAAFQDCILYNWQQRSLISISQTLAIVAPAPLCKLPELAEALGLVTVTVVIMYSEVSSGPACEHGDFSSLIVSYSDVAKCVVEDCCD